ncbi:hypothetical protein DMA11_22720 [Marinilabiliaceae bacterium JC017]|nr:hypothetical protein DMA11_22720 [Marinilabiliaceae bacterium JC017]
MNPKKLNHNRKKTMTEYIDSEYEEDLPIEDYIYEEPLKERHADTDRFKELIAIEGNEKEEDAIELLYISKRLFYNQHGLEKVLASRHQMMHFFDVDIDDDTIPVSMGGADGAKHTDQIEEALNALDDQQELKKLNIKKLANRFPEVPFFTLLKIVVMGINDETPPKILKQINEALSIRPNDLLLQLEKDTWLARQEQPSQYIKQDLIEKKTLSALFNNRKTLHSFELMSFHTALYEYLVTQKDLLLLDALMFCSNTLFPEWANAWSEKELYSELLKVQFCKMLLEV